LKDFTNQIERMIQVKINKEKVKDIAIRALKTFIQAFLSAISVDALFGVTDFDNLKKVLISILIAATAAGISAVWNMAQDMLRTYFAGKGAGTMSFDAFIKKYLGKATDYDGSCEAQCVDLIKMYFKYVLGIIPKAIGNAHAYFDNFALHAFLNKNFVRIKNSPKFVPMKGDVCVWSKKMNKYGHVAIATGEGNTSYFDSVDMNWGSKEARYITHNYDYFLGVLRPIDRTNIDGLKLCRVKKAVNVRRGPGTNFKRVYFHEFTAYQQEQVLANNGKAANNDFPKGMLVEVYETKGSWYKISETEEMWVHKNYVNQLG